jgi:hypothetical protein
MSFSDLNGGFQGGKIRRNSVPYAQHGGRPASERLVEELLRTRPIGELQRNATQSATSVDLAASITFRDGRTNPHRLVIFNFFKNCSSLLLFFISAIYLVNFLHDYLGI